MTAEVTTRSYVFFGLKVTVWLLMTIMIMVPMFDDKAIMWSDNVDGLGHRVGMFATYGWDGEFRAVYTPVYLNEMGSTTKVGLGIQGCSLVALLMTQASFFTYMVAVFGADNNTALRCIAGVMDFLTFVMCWTAIGLVLSVQSVVGGSAENMGNTFPLFASASFLAALSSLLSWCLSEAPFSCCCPPAVTAMYAVPSYPDGSTTYGSCQPHQP